MIGASAPGTVELMIDVSSAMAPSWLLGGGALLLTLYVGLRPGFAGRLVASRGAVMIGLLAVLTALVRVFNGVDDGGVLLLGGRLLFDPMTALFDLVLCALMLAALVTVDDADIEVDPSVRTGAGGREVLTGLACGPERAALMFVATIGAMITIHAVDLMTLVVGLELAGVAAAALVGRGRGREAAASGYRWLLVHGVSAAVLIMGLALIYGATSTLDLTRLGGKLSAVFTGWAAGSVQKAVEILTLPKLPIDDSQIAVLRDAAVKGVAPAALFVPGLLLVIAGLVTRLGAVFLHRSLPEVYAAAPTGAASFADTVTRVAGALALIRVLLGVFNTARLVYAPYGWSVALGTLAMFSLIVGALMAARQPADELRRLVAWGSLHQAGWILLGLVAAGDFYAHAGLRPGGLQIGLAHDWGMESGDRAVTGILLLVVSSAIASAGVFAALAFRARRFGGRDELGGLARRRPWLALALAVCLLSWIGAPLTGGFVGRATVVFAGLSDNNPMVQGLVVAAVLGAVALATAVARVLLTMLAVAPDTAREPRGRLDGVRRHTGIALAIAAILSLVIGVGGSTIWRPFQRAAAGSSLVPGSPQRGQRVERAMGPAIDDGDVGVDE